MIYKDLEPLKLSVQLNTIIQCSTTQCLEIGESCDGLTVVIDELAFRVWVSQKRVPQIVPCTPHMCHSSAQMNTALEPFRTSI